MQIKHASIIQFSRWFFVINPSIFTFTRSQNFVPMTKYRTPLWYQRFADDSHIFNYSLNHDYRNSWPPSRRFRLSERCFFMHWTQIQLIISALLFSAVRPVLSLCLNCHCVQNPTSENALKNVPFYVCHYMPFIDPLSVQSPLMVQLPNATNQSPPWA